MISPTGEPVRGHDIHGDGAYGASRGSRKHIGADYICEPGQPIISPIDGILIREARPYVGHEYSGVLIENSHIGIKIFYFHPDQSKIGKHVKKREVIGLADDISNKYPGITTHVHLQVEHINPELLMAWV